MSRFDAHIYGPFFSASGVGESTRAYWRTMRAAGLKVGIFPQNMPFNFTETSIAEMFRKYIVSRPHPELNFFRINAQEISTTPYVKDLRKSTKMKNVLIPMWETPIVPTNWREDVAFFTSIITPTHFIKNAFESLSLSLPISVVPHEVHIEQNQYFTNRQLGLPDDRKIHLYSFSYASHISRKNPNAFLELKREHCKKADYMADMFVLAASDLPKSAIDNEMHNLLKKEQDSNFIYLSGGRSRDQHYSLIGNANSFVSVHRSEGIGLQLVESILLGTPVSTHNFSGPSDFMHSSDIGVYRYQKAKIEKGEYPFAEGQEWADFSISDVNEATNQTVENGSVDHTLRRRVENHFSISRTSSLLEDLMKTGSY
jgi:glycosyltransferase involved in cell wall biosynthesis